MTIAHKVKSLITENQCTAFTLCGGYAVAITGENLRFPVGVNEYEKRNDQGRVTLSRTRYADNSVLEYRYSTKTERYNLTVKG